MNANPMPAAPLPIPVSFHDWDDSSRARRCAASLGHNHVQVWMAKRPADEADLADLARLLSADEIARARRLTVTEARRRFVFGRALLRQLLGACLEVAPATMAIGYGPHGKPRLGRDCAGAELRFNLSHSRSRVALALAHGRDVGIDIEWIDARRDWVPLAARIFSPRELAEWHALAPSQQPAAFFQGWTRKEAYLKATGAGLTDALPAIEVTLAPGHLPALLSVPAGPEAARQWALHSIAIAPEFAGAVVFDPSFAPLPAGPS